MATWLRPFLAIGRRWKAAAWASGGEPERDSVSVVPVARSQIAGSLRSSPLCRHRRHGPVSGRRGRPGNFPRADAEAGVAPDVASPRGSPEPGLVAPGAPDPEPAPRPRLSSDPAPLPLAAAQADPVPRKGGRGRDRRGRGKPGPLDGPAVGDGRPGTSRQQLG